MQRVQVERAMPYYPLLDEHLRQAETGLTGFVDAAEFARENDSIPEDILEAASTALNALLTVRRALDVCKPKTQE